MPCVWYAFVSGASGLPLYDAWSMLLFNTVYTALPSLCIGLFEKDLLEEIILKNPRVYRGHKNLQSRALFHWITNAIFHSLIVFFGAWAIHQDKPLYNNGQMTDLQTFGTFVMFICYHIVLLKILLETGHWIIWTWLSIGLSIVSYYVVEIILGIGLSAVIPELTFVFPMTLRIPSLWFGLFLAIPACLVTDISFKYFNRQTWPKSWYILQELDLQQKKTSATWEPSDSRKLPLLLHNEDYERL